MVSGIIKVEVRLQLITLTETLMIPDITKTQSNNCFIILYLQVITQFLAGSMSELRSHSYFAVRELDIAVRALDIALGNHALRAQHF